MAKLCVECGNLFLYFKFTVNNTILRFHDTDTIVTFFAGLCIEFSLFITFASAHYLVFGNGISGVNN